MEYYLSRGMDINAFAPNLSFPAKAGFRKASTFFSNGMDPEYAVMGRVAMPSRRRYGRQARLRIIDRRTAQPGARVPLRASNGKHER
jgi:methylmalonyl-CoA mutase